MLVPQFSNLTLQSLLDQLHKDTADIRHMDIAPRAFAFPYLDPFPALHGYSRELRNLDAPLVDRPSAASIDDWREDEGSFGSVDRRQTEDKVVDYPLRRVPLNESSELICSPKVVVDRC